MGMKIFTRESVHMTKMAAVPISRVVKFQINLRGGLLYNNLTIFRKSVWAFSVIGFLS